MNDDIPPQESKPSSNRPPVPAPDEFSPITPERSSFMDKLARGLLGLVSFVIAVIVFAGVMATNQPIGLLLSVAAVVALFVHRKRSGPSPMLGAVVVGVGLALAVTGTCTMIVMSLS